MDPLHPSDTPTPPAAASPPAASGPEPSGSPRPLETFVVLCGMPRCGTRQFADFLNRHPRLCLQGEIRGTLLGTIRGALEAAQQAYPRGYAARAFREKRARGVIDLFGLLSKGNRITKQGADIHGFKCPQMERQQGHITAIVRPAFKRLVWLHAIRNPVDCWLSLRAMPWFSDDPDQFVERYCSSLDYARTLAERSGGGNKHDHRRARPRRLHRQRRQTRLARPAPVRPARPCPERRRTGPFRRDDRQSQCHHPRHGRRAVPHARSRRPRPVRTPCPRLEAAIAAYNARLGTQLALRLPPLHEARIEAEPAGARHAA
jgi:hypothetical protein